MTNAPRYEVDPFRTQEPWVYQTASRDQPVRRFERRHVKALRAAGECLLPLLHRRERRGELELALAGLETDHFQGMQAIGAARRLVEENAGDQAVHLWMAQLSHALSEPDRCTHFLVRAGECDAENAASTHQLAALERERGRLDRATEYATRLLACRPTDPRASLELGLIARGWGDASSARDHFAQAAQHAQQDEILLRELNRAEPGLLTMDSRLREPRLGGRCAILVPGHLRRLNSSFALLESLSQHCDLFLCTNDEYRSAARELAAATGAAWTVIEDEASDAETEAALPVPSMKQWFKLNRCLATMLRAEREGGFRYRYVYKLRTDYFHADAAALLDLREDDEIDGLFAASDKVFGGRREYVLPLAGLWQAMGIHFLDRERTFWPINARQILDSSDSYKWFGMNVPRRIVGRCHAVETLRRVVATKVCELTEHRPRPFDRYVSLFKGHPRMASEICFARYLNLLGITVRHTPRLGGFLLSGRAG